MLRSTVQVGHGQHRRTQTRLVRIASTGYSVTAGGKTQLHATLNQTGRNAVAHAGSHHIQLQVTATVGGGLNATRVMTLTPAAAHR
jgi:hypothetical protein